MKWKVWFAAPNLVVFRRARSRSLAPSSGTFCFLCKTMQKGLKIRWRSCFVSLLMPSRFTLLQGLRLGAPSLRLLGNFRSLPLPARSAFRSTGSKQACLGLWRRAFAVSACVAPSYGRHFCRGAADRASPPLARSFLAPTSQRELLAGSKPESGLLAFLAVRAAFSFRKQGHSYVFL